MANSTIQQLNPSYKQYTIVGFGYAVSTSLIYVVFPIPNMMNTSYNVTFTDVTIINVGTATVSRTFGKYVASVYAEVSHAGLTAYRPYIVTANATFSKA